MTTPVLSRVCALIFMLSVTGNGYAQSSITFSKRVITNAFISG